MSSTLGKSALLSVALALACAKSAPMEDLEPEGTTPKVQPPGPPKGPFTMAVVDSKIAAWKRVLAQAHPAPGSSPLGNVRLAIRLLPKREDPTNLPGSCKPN